MILFRTAKYGIVTLVIFSSLLLLGCGGCASQKPKDVSAIPNFNELNPNTKSIYAFLLFDQALRQEDSKMIIIALQELSNHNPPPSVYIDAGIFFLENDPKAIIPILKKAIQAHSEETSLHLLYAELLQKTGQSKEAIAHIRKLMEKEPTNMDAKLELVLLLVNAKQHTEAERILLDIPSKDRSGFVEYYHAKALIGMNRFDEALGHLLKALEEMPYFIEGLADAARIYEELGEFENARDYYEKLLFETGQNPEIALRIIYLSLRLKEFEKAQEYFEHNDTENVPFSAAVASMLVEEQYYDAAEDILQKLISSPGAPQELFFYLAAIAYERDKDPIKALQYVDHVQENNANYDRALLLRMQLLIELQRLDEALEVSRKGQQYAKNQKARLFDFIMTEIRLLASLDQMDEAIDKAEELTKLAPEHEGATFLFASLLDQHGEHDEALSMMEKIIKKNPDHYQALNYVGYTLAEKSRDLTRAVRLLRKAVSLSPQSDYILDSLAWALFRSGNTQEAWEIIQKAILVSTTSDPTIWEHYAEIARSLGHKAEARKGYEQALTFNPANAESIKKRLTDL